MTFLPTALHQVAIDVDKFLATWLFDSSRAGEYHKSSGVVIIRKQGSDEQLSSFTSSTDASPSSNNNSNYPLEQSDDIDINNHHGASYCIEKGRPPPSISPIFKRLTDLSGALVEVNTFQPHWRTHTRR